MLSDRDLERLHRQLAGAIERHVEPLFVGDAKITLLVRHRHIPEGGVVVSNDDLNEAIDEIRRLNERPGKVRPATP